MLALKTVIVILVSVLYGGALATKTVIRNSSKHQKISEVTDLVFAFACLTSIYFMCDGFGLSRYIEYLCCAVVLLFVIIVPIIEKVVKDKRKNR